MRRTRELRLPPNWSTLERAAFASALEEWTRDDVLLRFDDADLSALARALQASDESSVRAAVILGNTRDPRAFDRLATRLEARVPDNGRSVAGDVVAASACASVLTTRADGARLEALALGPDPHPVLEVRVECALTALYAGRDAGIPFLLDLLREGTAGAVRNPNWRRIDWNEPRLQRLQDRAARALSARAGIECEYRAGGSPTGRERALVRLAHILQTPASPR
ncbi:MAG: hypothetical protein JNL28_03510 [Planctomycetes bacterium]|nr:hypothetical protein [Planctomycetota bacterium]